MAKPTAAKQTYVPPLLDLFRQYGYDGVSLSKISQATGLGKASLYHHFPGGKDDMVTTVLDTLDQRLQETALDALNSEGDALARLTRMGDRICEAYNHGQKPCMLASLMLGSAKDDFQPQVQGMLRRWMGAIAAVLTQSGMPESLAQERSEEALIAIQGALIMARAMDDAAIFERTMQRLPQQLCR
ncbi:MULTISPECIES: TetR/AcrR family transcriptional regulator [Cyanophyceae]|uniref:TetR/AcrR family transcriptional regulator n=1 Tax=Cyanophyceae TaxID=3028117 RepID=UPI0016870E3F|nr:MULTISPECIES: TetR/AcrR family transcriptional regulator [Cyanophyceae]MBD1914850.1 TetR/AcrR family transcriptional regulator [Phormidium sp. FACHB-77]MBD2031014.1 TetR/AcrR family transcriptional regulator [Phormidium sp. FACHB-322]MBD2052621.1 TetR/AcrR family transcriptional regulator [Leptolyngbya sp. FACHB-60]